MGPRVVVGVTVASAKHFRTLSRNYPDWLVLVRAPASPQPLWVFALTASSSGTPLDPPDLWDIRIAALVLPWDCFHMGKLRHWVGRKSPVQSH